MSCYSSTSRARQALDREWELQLRILEQSVDFLEKGWLETAAVAPTAGATDFLAAETPAVLQDAREAIQALRDLRLLRGV